jgi:SH3 domain protein
MKWFILIVTLLSLYATNVQAERQMPDETRLQAQASVRGETMYVDGDLVPITFRTGPGIVHTIISELRSGQKVEVIEHGEEWAKVRLPNEREGWVIRRFITPNPPSTLVVKILGEKNKALTVRAASFMEENKQIKAENTRLAEELAQCQENQNKISQSYETLRSESAQYIELKAKYEKTSAQLVEQTTKVDKLEKELTKMQLNKSIWWFISGAGVLVLGLLIGFSAKRQRRRSSLL